MGKNNALIGWLFVAVQAVVLVALIVLPGRDDWPTPASVRTVGYGLLVVGLVIIAVGALGLGKSVTPTPVPVSYGQLQTGGLYRFVRHPIYTGVLAIVAGLTIRSGSFISLAVAAATLVFFHVKARWEEQRLAERYEGYAAYAAATPRFVPRFGGRN